MRPIFQTETLPRIQYQSTLLVLAITCFPSVGYTECTSKCAGDDAGVGEIRTSLLEADDFIELYGRDWRLMNGKTIKGKPLAGYTGKNSLPDARGRFLRMANNTASGEDRDVEQARSIGSLQKSSTKRHQHLYKDAYFTYPRYGNDPGYQDPDNKEKYPKDKKDRVHPDNVLVNYPVIVDYVYSDNTFSATGLAASKFFGASWGGFPYYKLNVTGNARCHPFAVHNTEDRRHCWMTITDWEGNPKLNWTKETDKTITNSRGKKEVIPILDRSEQDIAQLVEWNAKKKMADAIDDRESRPVNIAVNYFVRVDCTTSDHCSNK